MATGEVYEEAARLMLEGDRKGISVASILKTHCPWIESQLRKTAKYPNALGLWGRSLNVDEHANTIIVEPAILQVIGELAGIPLRGRIVHAGLEHTYGYLFSLIETPYGKKRDRWILPDLDNGLGFEKPTLRDQPDTGTLLLNLTYCLGAIAFRDQAVLLDRMRMELTGASPLVREYPFDELRIRRMVETVTLPNGRRKGTRIDLVTDLVTLPYPASQTSAQRELLVYSIVNGPRLGPQLITAFPVSGNSVEEILSPENQGDNVEVRTKYNAYIAGLSGQSVIGRRFLVT